MSRTRLRRLVLAGALAAAAVGLGGCYAYPVGYAGYSTYGYDDYAYAPAPTYSYPRYYTYPQAYSYPRYYNYPTSYGYPRYYGYRGGYGYPRYGYGGGYGYPRYGYRGGYGYYGDDRGNRR
ncbi:hypothetical protein FFK22_019800 [Mycobacterium sp. KBS0706]|uniref:hypothetical protein n=1 Tax=Mycobacterium sp. KBS0706 TaxID=2578109 RepID=UPI00110FB721|nr:hypothetical protein [Mycobacterium sp. KBS0706]TSD86977.1 hypothetical protein FFK22_019800 [Mycobacterium sp. KBS0706]